MSTSRYPLSWPVTWARWAGAREVSPFYRKIRGTYNTRPITMEEACKFTMNELKLLGVSDGIISTNVRVRADVDFPIGNGATPKDPGAAVYFTMKKRPMVLACDRWRRLEDNIEAIGRHIEATRAQQRHGVGSTEQAFAGYTALPPPGSSGAPTWYRALNVTEDVGYDVAVSAYRALAMQAHPDQPGGSTDKMQALNAAWDQAKRHFGK